MEPIKIVCTVSAAVAIRGASSLAGREVVELSPGMLAALSEVEREEFARLVYPEDVAPASPLVVARRPLALPTTDTSPTAVVEALRSVVAASLEAKAAETARQVRNCEEEVEVAMKVEIQDPTPGAVAWERWAVALASGKPVDRRVLDEAIKRGVAGAVAAFERVEALGAQLAARRLDATREVAARWSAAPVATRVEKCEQWRVSLPPVAFGGSLWRAHEDAIRRYSEAHPQFAAALAEARAEVQRLNELEAAARAEATALAEARAEAANVRSAAVREALRLYALGVPSLQAAAAADYDVAQAALRELSCWVAKHVRSEHGIENVLVVDRAHGAAVYRYAERKAPSSEVVKLQQALTKTVRMVAFPDGVSAKVSRVQRVTTDTRDGMGSGSVIHTTGVVVTIEAPEVPELAAEKVIFFCE